MEQRENVFTQFARDINSFACHNINKEQLFESFVDMIEMCSENEKQERSKCNSELKGYYAKDLSEHLIGKIEKPYFNYDKAKELLSGL
jgi:phosphoserine aminotransferase